MLAKDVLRVLGILLSLVVNIASNCGFFVSQHDFSDTGRLRIGVGRGCGLDDDAYCTEGTVSDSW